MNNYNVNENITRKQWIDEKLKHSGWTNILPYSEDLDIKSLDKAAIEEFPNENGFADYALVLQGMIVGIVEAKKVRVAPQNVLNQANRYASVLRDAPASPNYWGVPFIYSTNGFVIWFQDLRQQNSRSRSVSEFHTPEAIEELLNRNNEKFAKWYADNPPPEGKLRDYQKEAIVSVEKAIQDDKRSMLLAMATGTGKTYTMASLIYRLLKSGTSKRVLFLVDRKALAAQAVMEFASFDADDNLKFNQIYQVYSQSFQKGSLDEGENFDFTTLPSTYLTNPDGSQVFVYVSTIQRMRINLFGREGMFSESGDYDPEDDADKLDIPIHAFDTIIADECHRGYTSQEDSKWREVLDHFDAVKIGLTATPAAHTTSFFKHIVFRYSYEQAVQAGYLVDYDAVKISSGVRLKGISIKAGEEIGNIDPETGIQQLDLLEDEKHFEATEVERAVTSPDSNRKIIEEFAKYAYEHEKATGRFPKTLIFAHNDLQHTSHADQIVNICRDVFGKGDAFVQKITGSANVDKPLQRIKEFRNRPEPHIVVTVDMLSTGVDIPSIECIVFLRQVRSRILFEQMMGRGTRLCKNFPNGLGTPDKTHFTVFDCFDGTLLESFKNETGMTQVAPTPPTRSLEKIIEEISNNIDYEYNLRCLIKRLQRIDKNITLEGRDLLSKFVADGDIGHFAKELPANLDENRTSTLKLLNNQEFINLLKNYPKAPKKFTVAITTEDEVGSEYLFRTTDGRELKSEDYIVAFERFVKENPEHIEAISIVLEKPKGWNTQALRELRKSLKEQPERYTEDNLRKAYKYPLADIISMVKHAGKEEPLLSAKERVDLAIEKVFGTEKLTEKQQMWVDLIRKFLVEHLTLEAEDFNDHPIFTDRGANYNLVDRDFNNKLMLFIEKINSAIPEVFVYAK